MCEDTSEVRRSLRCWTPFHLLVKADAGVENLNRAVDELIASGLLRCVLAQVDVWFSSSMLEAWWRSLKHPWICLSPLEILRDVRRFVAFYVESHNGEMGSVRNRASRDRLGTRCTAHGGELARATRVDEDGSAAVTPRSEQAPCVRGMCCRSRGSSPG